MDKKKIALAFFAILIVAATAINVNFALRGNKSVSDLALANVVALADSESGSSDNWPCSAGGIGSTSCSISATIAGNGVGCSVTCDIGYYACCNAFQNKCQCRKY